MTIAGILFLATGLFIAGRASGSFPGIPWLPVVNYVYHTGLAVYYGIASYGTQADSYEYFMTSKGSTFSLGTESVPWLTGLLVKHLGTSYLDLFLFFQLFGYMGVLIFASTLLRLCQGAPHERRARTMVVLIAFLPGLNYWSTAIGKDPFAVLAIALVIDAVSRPKTRLAVLLLGCLLMLAIRPHMFILLVPAVGAAIALAGSRSVFERLTVAAACGVGVALALPFVFRYISLDEVSGVAISSNLQSRLQENSVGGGAVDLSSTPIWGKFFAYFYRPLFIDTTGVLGFIASVENLLLLVISVIGLGTGLRNISSTSILRPTFAKFAIFYGIGGGVLVSLTLSNLGIALRQKYMFMMPLLALLVFVTAMRRCTAADGSPPGSVEKQAAERPDQLGSLGSTRPSGRRLGPPVS